ncbi:DUF2510 domain-containing protein [Streptomyces lavendulae]|uniref:DUF2510 domain-containing protein n=1 Tax=Streptomyces lavendulae TaxID=1914 RepID=UPI0036A1BFF4
MLPHSGWYYDTSGNLRWWDGNRWTEHLSGGRKKPVWPDSPPKGVSQPGHGGDPTSLFPEGTSLGAGLVSMLVVGVLFVICVFILGYAF